MRRYTVQINGITTTLRLTDKTATARGLTPDPDPAQAVEADEVAAKAKKPANKARKPANKRAEIAAQAFGAKTEDD